MSLTETLPLEGSPKSRRPGARLLVVLEGGAQVMPLPEAGVVRIGRGDDQDVRIEHPSVSRRHALLHLGPPVELEDVGSANGIRSRGERLSAGKRVRVVRGEPFEIGGVLCMLDVPETGTSLPLPQSGQGAGGPVLGAKMRELQQSLQLVARGTVSVLLLGETGVGKEVWARRVHELSLRAAGPFIGINCAALPESLLENELFGHEKGAFTGALASRPGLFEAAHGGTLFLDEMGDLPLALQPKLLRVLEEHKVRRLGSAMERTVDLRVVAATHRDLQAEAQAGRFRSDLYFRLAGYVLRIPPLRDRVEELEPLARHFLAEHARRAKSERPPELPSQTLEALRAHTWPGNIRELKNALETAALLAGDGPIRPEHLPNLQRPSPSVPATSTVPSAVAPSAGSGSGSGELLTAEEERERADLVEALGKAAGNQTRAAELLGISRRWLSEKMNRYGIPRPRRRD